MTEPDRDLPDGRCDEIDELLRMVAELVGMEAAAEPAERPALAALRGLLRVDVFELDARLADLDVAVVELAAAARDAPDHPDAALWHYVRGVAHHRLAGIRESPDDLRHAIECLRTALGHPPHPDLDADVITIELAELHCRLYAASGAGGRAAIDRLVAELDRITHPGTDPYPREYLSMLRGEARLTRFGITGDAGDLDAAIELLAPVVPRLPADVPNLSEAAYDLACAYRTRYERDDDPDDLDQAIHVASAAALRTDDRDEFRPPLLELHGDCLFARWRARQEHADLDTAIVSLLDAAGAEPPPPLVAECLADTYAARAAARADAADWRHSASWYARAAQSGGPDAWTLLAGQAHAHLELHTLTRDHAVLTAALRSLGELIACPDLGDEPFLEAHHQRMKALLHWVEPPFVRDRPSAVADVLRMAEEAEHALRQRAEAPPAARADLALSTFRLLNWATGEGYLAPDFDRLLGLLRIAQQRSDIPDSWQRLLTALAVHLTLLADAYRYSGEGGYGMDLTLPELDLDDAHPDLVAACRGLALTGRLLQTSQRGDIGGLQEVVEQLTAGPDVPGTKAVNDAAVLAALIRISQCLRTGDLVGLGVQIETALAGIAAAPPSPWTDQVTVAMLYELRQLLREGGITGTHDDTPRDAALPVFGAAHTGIVAGLRTAHEFLAARRDGDVARARALLGDLVAMIAQRGADDPLRLSLSGMAANMAESPEFDTDDSVVEQSVGWARDGLDLARGPWHPQWGRLALSLANLQRRRAVRGRGGPADRTGSRHAGLRALHGHAWQALLQSGTDDAMSAARDAADVAVTVARWCIADADAAPSPERREILHELVRALDSGRGLVLHAATSSRRVEDMLRDGGHPDLARQWSEEYAVPDDRNSGDLRYRVLRALAPEQDAAPGPDPLLDPPTVADIGRALRHGGGDALVYLFAGAAGSGHAVMVTAGEQVSALTLPDLRDDAPELAAYLRIHGARHAADADTDADSGGAVWRAGLSEVCRWAWNAAIGEILRDREGTGSPTPRLVLVPMGALALVPWQAAWRVEDGVRRYAVSDAVFSVVASARLLCDVVAREPVRGDAALIVGNPGGDLTAAGIEAQAIHQRFYPSGTYLGQPLDYGHGAGTADEVTGWLLGEAGPRAMVHIAGHCTVDAARPAESCLHLADGDQLPIRGLVERTRGAQREIGAVWLAACTTGMAGDFYDESLSMATAFLAAGARSVYGSMWVVPDSRTSLLMFMSHHFLREQPGDAAEALRRAQLWMLDRDRAAPDTMPAELARHARSLTAADPVFWAGFVHLGTSAAIAPDQGVPASG